MISRNTIGTGLQLLGIGVLSLGLGTSSAPAAEHGGLHLCRISRPNGIVMVVELYGYETDSAKEVQTQAYNETLDDWNYRAREWADLIEKEAYPVPKPVDPKMEMLEDLTGKSDEERAAARDKHRASLENWAACTITDMHGNASARAIRNDYLFRVEILEMSIYAKAVVRWAEMRKRDGDEAAGERPVKPVIRKIKEGLKSASDAQVWVDKANEEIAAEREKSGKPAPDSNPPSIHRSEERRVGKECRSRWSPYH